ncbi:MAG: 30S ribosomal protein S6 [Lachnospiraceae bacterium]|nr:30S ribosomal protein S6 [Lachnospiraceae bacterium]
MNKYELCVVVSAKLEDDARAELVDRVKDLIARFEGTVTDVDDWGKKRLAYEIEKMHEAFYYFIHFESEPEAPAQIEGRLRIMDGVLRYLCVRQDA